MIVKLYCESGSVEMDIPALEKHIADCPICSVKTAKLRRQIENRIRTDKSFFLKVEKIHRETLSDD